MTNYVLEGKVINWLTEEDKGTDNKINNNKANDNSSNI